MELNFFVTSSVNLLKILTLWSEYMRIIELLTVQKGKSDYKPDTERINLILFLCGSC